MSTLIRFVIGAALVVFTAWAGGFDFERGKDAVAVIVMALIAGLWASFVYDAFLGD